MEDIFDFDVNAISEVDASEMNDNEDFFEEYLNNGKKAFRCTYNNCGKVFKYKSDITRHGLIHSNTRPYFCPFEGCKKSFKRPDVLDGHVRTHTRQLPFECSEPGCNAKFTSNAGLKYHLLKHKGDKPFTCAYDGCGRSFMTLAQLKQHESTLKYHKGAAPSTPMRSEEEIVHKVQVFESKEKKDDMEYFMPKPRAAKTLMWEIKNPDELDQPEIVNAPEKKAEIYNLDEIMGFFMEENKNLKKQLDECTKKLMTYKEEEETSYNYRNEEKLDIFPLESPTDNSSFDLNGFRSPLPQLDLMNFKQMSSHFDENPLTMFDFMKDGPLSPL